MEKQKDDIFKAFTAKAAQRLKDKKVRRYETLYVPSLDQNIKIRNLDYPEIVECTEIEDANDPNASDKYCTRTTNIPTNSAAECRNVSA